MPLKHHTETAYMIVLGLIICVLGFFLALLPSIPTGIPYWAAFLVLSVLYPLLLARTLRSNRADYEFRMMHWFPFGMVALWMILEIVGPKAYFLRILQLGFFFLWSLPLVGLGIFFLILFATHVIRRSFIRVTVLSIFLTVFTLGALAAEAMHKNTRLSRQIYANDLMTDSTLSDLYQRTRSYLGVLTGTSDSVTESPSSVASLSSSRLSSSDRSRALAMQPSSSSSAPLLMSSSKPTTLPSSGPETAAVLIATLLALYMGTVHMRAGRRV